MLSRKYSKYYSQLDDTAKARYVAKIQEAKVHYSQTVSAQPAHPWVAAQTNGTIICAHCTFMAGLGEVCSHISALLFTIEAHQISERCTLHFSGMSVAVVAEECEVCCNIRY